MLGLTATPITVMVSSQSSSCSAGPIRHGGRASRRSPRPGGAASIMLSAQDRPCRWERCGRHPRERSGADCGNRHREIRERVQSGAAKVLVPDQAPRAPRRHQVALGAERDPPRFVLHGRMSRKQRHAHHLDALPLDAPRASARHRQHVAVGEGSNHPPSITLVPGDAIIEGTLRQYAGTVASENAPTRPAFGSSRLRAFFRHGSTGMWDSASMTSRSMGYRIAEAQDRRWSCTSIDIRTRLD